MLKHATICRTSRAQLPSDSSWSQDRSQLSSDQRQQVEPLDVVDAGDLNNNSENKSISIFNGGWLSTTRSVTSCSSSPTPSLITTPTSKCPPLSSAPSSVFSTPTKASNPTTTLQYNANRSAAGSMVKIFAQTLSQDVEYVTLHLNTQTKSQQVIRTLLKKFRLKHRDPNLFYLTLERWIRKDGVKFKSVMLLGDNACPLQLQQCCPPHDESKFTLQMRSGALIKIFCSDVCSSTKYKCLSLASQTTVEETIGLMLHCLNLTVDCESKQANPSNDEITSQQNLTLNSTTGQHHSRQTSSPSSTGSSISAASSTSSSSGIESDLMNQNPRRPNNTANQQASINDRLDMSSRASSVASISSSSNLSNMSNGHLFSDHYCLIIECENTNYKRVLEADNCLVEVYQALLDEALDQADIFALTSGESKSLKSTSSASSMLNQSIKSQPDKWFVIKLQRRDDLNHHSVKFTNPRQNMPLPPIPPSLAQFSNVANLQSFVSTAQIEVNHHHLRRPSHTALPLIKQNNSNANGQVAPIGSHSKTSSIATARSRPVVNCHQKQISAIVSTGCEKMPPSPQALIWLPPIMPRRRNLSNASSTFGRPQNGLASGGTCNRRRYDPLQLAEDLNQLNLNVEPIGPVASQVGRIGNVTSDRQLVIEQSEPMTVTGPKAEVDSG